MCVTASYSVVCSNVICSNRLDSLHKSLCVSPSAVATQIEISQRVKKQTDCKCCSIFERLTDSKDCCDNSDSYDTKHIKKSNQMDSFPFLPSSTLVFVRMSYITRFNRLKQVTGMTMG